MFRCVTADPPWNESGGGRIKRGADRHYKLMKTRDILELMHRLLFGYSTRSHTIAPVFSVASDSHLWLWCTNNFLPDALFVMRELGYRYINNKVWVKAQKQYVYSQDGKPQDCWKPQRPGLGQYQGGQHELLLFGVRGKQPAVWKDKTSGKKRPGSVILAPRGEHSVKPVEVYEHIEATSPGPYLELFVRGPGRAGWTVWGDEAEGANDHGR